MHSSLSVRYFVGLTAGWRRLAH